MRKLTDCFSELYIEKEFTLSICRDGVILSLSPVETTLMSWTVKNADSLLVASKEISAFLKHHREHRFHPLFKAFQQVTKENSNSIFENMLFVVQNGLFGNTKIFDKYEGNFRGENVIPFENFLIWTENCNDFQEKAKFVKENKSSQKEVQNSSFLKTRDNRPSAFVKIKKTVFNWFRRMKWALIFLTIELIIFASFMNTGSEELGRVGILFGVFSICYCLSKIAEEFLRAWLYKMQEQDKEDDN